MEERVNVATFSCILWIIVDLFRLKGFCQNLTKKMAAGERRGPVKLVSQFDRQMPLYLTEGLGLMLKVWATATEDMDALTFGTTVQVCLNCYLTETCRLD